MHLVRSSGHEHNWSPYHDQDAMDVDQTCITRTDSEREKWWESGGAVKDSLGSGPKILHFCMFWHRTACGLPVISDSCPHKQSHRHRSSRIPSLPPFIHTLSPTLTHSLFSSTLVSLPI